MTSASCECTTSVINPLASSVHLRALDSVSRDRILLWWGVINWDANTTHLRPFLSVSGEIAAQPASRCSNVHDPHLQSSFITGERWLR